MTKSKNNDEIRWDYLISGTVAGGASAALFHPLELIKIRFQVNETSKPKLLNYDVINKIKIPLKSTSTIITNKPSVVYRPAYKNIIDSVYKIYKNENGFKGLYRGCLINTYASGTAWGVYFLIYNTLKQNNKIIQDNLNVNLKTNKLTSILANYTLDATLAGIITICITNPLFLIKTRMCLQYAYEDAGAVTKQNVVKYKSIKHAFEHLLKTDGLKGLYKGLIPGLFGTINGTLQMVSYDLMKQFWLKYYKNKEELNSKHYLIFSALSKSFAVVMTFPFQLIRARIQDQHRSYKNLTEVIRNLYRYEGFVGFYKGLVPGLIRVTPAASVTFFIYENLLKLLSK